MSTFQANDKVVCIDATPIPIGDPNHSFIDFTFPNGYIEEGSVYCVQSVVPSAGGCGALYLVGPRAMLRFQNVPWDNQRFRKVTHQKQKAKRSAKQSQPQKNTRLD